MRKHQGAGRRRVSLGDALESRAVLAAILVLLSTGAAQAHEVLLLYSIGQGTYPAIESSIRAGFADAPGGSIEIYPEFLDPLHFGESTDRQIFADYLKAKYRTIGVDAVIAVSHEALEFLDEHRDMFGFAPVVFATEGTSTFAESAPPGSSAVVAPFLPTRTVELALRLQPDLEHVFVVSGASEFDSSRLETLRNDLGALESSLDIEYLIDLSIEDVLDRVARLPANSMILYGTMHEDSAERNVVPREVAEQLSGRANAPVYGFDGSYLGRGIVGGYLATTEQLGAEVARRTLGVLAGERPHAIAEIGGSYVVDVREMNRWGLEQARLPAETERLFAPLSIWTLYQGWIITLLVLVAVQFALIVALLIQSISRRRDRLELAETAHRFRLARIAGKVGIWQWDLTTEQMRVEPDLKELLGYDPEQDDPTTIDWRTHIHDDDLPSVRRAARNHVQGQTPHFEIRHRMLDKDGNVRWFLSRGQAVRDRHGECTRLVGTSIDITESKRIEAERARTQLELQEQRNELAHLGRAAMAGALSGALAHELNQPLSAMLSNARAGQQFLEKSVVDWNELKDILVDIENDGRRAGDVIHHLRNLMRRGEGESSLVHLEAIIDDVLRLIHSDLVGRNIKVVRASSIDVPPIAADSVQLQQVILNLLANASDAMISVGPRDRTIAIEVAMTDAPGIRLSISDSGCGLPDRNPERIFKPFVTTKRNGLGLGLSISRSIVEVHGGKIWAENNPNGGATFHVDFVAAAQARVA